MENNNSYPFPIMLSITLIFLSILLFIPDIVVYKIINIGPLQESAAILFFPLVYSIADSLTEVYGRKKTLIILGACYAASFIFSVLLSLVMRLPSASENGFTGGDLTLYIENGPWVMLVGFISVATSMYVNVRLMSKWKIKLRNKHFILRSIFASSIGELIVTGIAYPLIFYNTHNDLLALMAGAYFFKVLYSIVGAFPARLLVFLLRYVDQIEDKGYSVSLRR